MRLLVTGVPRKFLLCELVTSLREGGSHTHVRAHTHTHAHVICACCTCGHGPRGQCRLLQGHPESNSLLIPGSKWAGSPQERQPAGGAGLVGVILSGCRTFNVYETNTVRRDVSPFKAHVLCGACLRGLLREPVRPAWTPPPQHPQAGGAQRGTC